MLNARPHHGRVAQADPEPLRDRADPAFLVVDRRPAAPLATAPPDHGLVAEAARASSKTTGGGTSSSRVEGAPAATSSSPSSSETASFALRRTARGRSSGGGRRSETVATGASMRSATTPHAYPPC